MGFVKEMFGPTDMTEGAPWEKIAVFAVPMLIGNVAQQLYNTVDSIVVGRYVGDNALAAVGSAGPILQLLIVLFVGISMGASIMVSQYLGGRMREELSKTIGNCITVTAVATVFMMVVGTLTARPLLELLDTPDSIIDWCQSYLTILFLGACGLAYFNILSGVLRGLGDSISALVYLLISTVLNIVLDVYFVKSLGMGVAGVALATVIAQFVSGALCLWKLARMREYFDLKKQYLKPESGYIKKLVQLGLPSGATQAIMSMSMLVVQSLTNSFGETFIAANVIVMRVDGFAMLPNMSFGTAMTTYAGQNVGAGRYDRVEQGAKQGTLMALGVSAVLTSMILIFGRTLMGIFTDTDSLVDLSRQMMSILAAGYVATAISQSLSGVMRGAGDTVTPMWISLVTTVLIRVPLAYLMVWMTRSEQFPKGRQECVFISLLISWLVGALINFIFYRRGKWKKGSMVAQKAA